MNPIAQIFLKHFPIALDYLDEHDADDPSAIAGAIAEWFSQAPNAPNRHMHQRMEVFYADPLVSVNYGNPPSNAASVMQVGFFELLWWLPNAELTIPQVKEYLNAQAIAVRTAA